MDVSLQFDQSPFVTNSLRGLIIEGLLGAGLTGLMVLIFLRDWRSAVIVIMNIPFALLSAVILLWATGQTINIMTLGGLALAVGVLVDEATVEIENIHTQMLPGISRARAVVEACSRTAMARLLSMFCILAVFVPSFFMVGVSRQLFVPLSLAVAFSMIASYLLSSSLVPVFSTWLMREAHRGEEHEGIFGHLRSFYERYLRLVLRFRWPLVLGYLAVAFGLLYVLLPRMGTELFPDANAPLLRVRLRAPAGTRIEETERIVLRALNVIQQDAGKDNVLITSDFMGVVPSSYPVDLIHLFTSGPQEAIIQVAVKPDTPRGEALRERIRADLRQELPACQVSFEAADIVSQVMSFGSPTPIEVAVQGPSLAERLRIRPEDSIPTGKTGFRPGSAIRAGVQLPDAGHQHQSRTGGPIRADHGGRGAFGCAGDVLFPVHGTELLARSEFGQRVPDSGGAAAESHAKRRKRRRAPDHAGRPPGHRTDKHCADEAGDDAGAD